MRTALSVALFAVASLFANRASAYYPIYWNWNYPPWNGTAYFYRNLYSLPNGTLRSSDVIYGFDVWNEAIGVKNVFLHVDGDMSSTISHTDNINTIFYTAALGSNLGTTFIRYWDYQGIEKRIVEADIGISSTQGLDMGNPACASYELGNRTTIMHEMGHAIGMEHYDWAPNLMMTSDGETKSCGARAVAPMPDDLFGARAKYGDGSTGLDIAASEYRYMGANDVKLNTSTVSVAGTQPPAVAYVCRGSTYSFRWSVANLGTSQVTYDVAFYLSEDNKFFVPSEIVWYNYGASINPGAFISWQQTITIPSNWPPGEYFLGWRLDYDNVVTEVVETNNLARNHRKVSVAVCG